VLPLFCAADWDFLAKSEKRNPLTKAAMNRNIKASRDDDKIDSITCPSCFQQKT
jgi:hypothetical protein